MDELLVEDLSFEEDYFIDEPDININENLFIFQEELEMETAIKLSLTTNVSSFDILDPEVILFEVAKHLLSSALNLSLVNKRYNTEFKNSYYNILGGSMSLKQIPEITNLKYCYDLLARNERLVEETIIIRSKIYQRAYGNKFYNFELNNKIQSFRMVAFCNNEYKILAGTTIYLKIVIAGKSYYYHQKVAKYNIYYDQILDEVKLKIGCPFTEAKRLLDQ